MMRARYLTPCLALFSLALAHAAPAPSAKPNFLVILADDLGFSDIGCYGSDIRTPNLDALAKDGLRFTQFYNTTRCWPTRSALMTGYYPQQIRADPPHGLLPAGTRTLPQWLKPLGYRCYHAGKWHVTGAPNPTRDAGFDHSYFLADLDRDFSPSVVWMDNKRLPPIAKDSGYYTTTALADSMIGFLKEHAAKYPNQPFFSYLAFNVPHFPLQAPPEDIARYRDQYLKGWDTVREQRWQNLRDMGIVNCALAPLEPAFTPRYFKPDVLAKLGPGEIQHPIPWDQLNDVQKRFQATKMAIHAAMIDRMDQEIGRVLAQVRAMGAWDNTLIFFLSDNGTDATILVRGDGNDRSAAPGSAGSFLCLGPGWSSAGNAPFRRHKVWTHEGGISTPLIVHWPAGISGRGELRHDVGHVIDFAPTLIELAGGKPDVASGVPPFPGRSLVPAFAKDNSVTRDYVFFNHEGNRGLRMGNYKLVSAREDHDVWELYDLSTDRCEQHNLATTQSDRLHAMIARWDQLEDEFLREAGDKPAPGSRNPSPAADLNDHPDRFLYGSLWASLVDYSD